MIGVSLVFKSHYQPALPACFRVDEPENIFDELGLLVFSPGFEFLLELYAFVGEGWEQEDDITLLTLRRQDR